MNILVLNWLDRENPAAGGAEVHLHETFSRIASRGHSVTLVCSGWPEGGAETELDGIEVHRVGGRYSYLLAARRYVRRTLRGRDFDVVVEDLNKVPLFAPWWTDVPVVALVHHLFGVTAFREGGLLLGAATWLLERPLPRAFAGRPVVAVSHSTADDLVSRGFDPAQIVVVRNGVDAEFFTPAGERFADPTILHLGRLRRYKRPDLALEAFGRLIEGGTEARLVFAGGGDEQPKLEQRARALGLGERVEFRGAVSEEEKRALYRRAWIHAVTSEKEGWGLTVVEAAACGTPSVASDVPGLRESVVGGETGLLVQHGDVPALADAFRKLLTQHEIRSQMGRRALAWARSLSWDRAADEMLAVLRTALERSRSDG